jgi:hypothetical protein
MCAYSLDSEGEVHWCLNAVAFVLLAELVGLLGRLTPPLFPASIALCRITGDAHTLGSAPHSTSGTSGRPAGQVRRSGNAGEINSQSSGFGTYRRGERWGRRLLFCPHELHHQLGLLRSYRVGREFNSLPLRVHVPASSANMRPRSSGECFSFVAIRAMPLMGLLPRDSGRAEISCIFRFGVPATPPPSLCPLAIYSGVP